MEDLIIIGAGPAGLSASVYASRYGLKNLVIGEVGGLMAKTHEIGNWLGEKKISGFEFSQKSLEHVKSLGVDPIASRVDMIEKKEDVFSVLLDDGRELKSRAVLFAAGTKHRKLGIPGEKEFLGKGVSYCATCDGFFFKEKTVVVAGGNDSAAAAAVYLSDICQKVFVVYRRDKLRAESFWLNAIEKKENIKLIYNANLKEIQGTNSVEKVFLDVEYDGLNFLDAQGIFVEIGLEPNTEILKNFAVEYDDDGFVKVDQEGRTSERGIWAAGDITTGSNKFRQIVTAASEGAIAANSIYKFLKK